MIGRSPGTAGDGWEPFAGSYDDETGGHVIRLKRPAHRWPPEPKMTNIY